MTDEELIARWDDYVESMGSVMGEVEHMAQQMRNRLEALVKERERCAKAGGDKAVEILLRHEPDAGLLRIQTTRQAIAAAIRATLKGDDHE